jgi:ATP-dependent RNA helicase DDX51/DBP6
MLSTRTVMRLRALVILPTRDLAVQVKTVFDQLVAGTPLRVRLQLSFVSVSGFL